MWKNREDWKINKRDLVATEKEGLKGKTEMEGREFSKKDLTWYDLIRYDKEIHHNRVSKFKRPAERVKSTVNETHEHTHTDTHTTKHIITKCQKPRDKVTILEASSRNGVGQKWNLIKEEWEWHWRSQQQWLDRRQWSKVIPILRANDFQPKILQELCMVHEYEGREKEMFRYISTQGIYFPALNLRTLRIHLSKRRKEKRALWENNVISTQFVVLN